MKIENLNIYKCPISNSSLEIEEVNEIDNDKIIDGIIRSKINSDLKYSVLNNFFGVSQVYISKNA